MTGSLIQWLRDNLGMVEKASDIEPLAASVDDWRRLLLRARIQWPLRALLARGCRRVINQSHPIHQQGHIAERRWRAAAFQSREVIGKRCRPTVGAADYPKVDGGMVVNELLMQFSQTCSAFPSCGEGHRDHGAGRGRGGRRSASGEVRRRSRN